MSTTSVLALGNACTALHSQQHLCIPPSFAATPKQNSGCTRAWESGPALILLFLPNAHPPPLHPPLPSLVPSTIFAPSFTSSSLFLPRPTTLAHFSLESSDTPALVIFFLSYSLCLATVLPPAPARSTPRSRKCLSSVVADQDEICETTFRRIPTAPRPQPARSSGYRFSLPRAVASSSPFSNPPRRHRPTLTGH